MLPLGFVAQRKRVAGLLAGGSLAVIAMAAPLGEASGGSSGASSAAIPTLTVQRPLGVASTAKIGNGVGSLASSIAVLTPSATATGNPITRPYQAPTVVQTTYADGRNKDATPVFATTPTVGNVIIAALYGDSVVVTSINGWTLFGSGGSGTDQTFLYYRYVQPGDTGSYPALSSGNSGYEWAGAAEVSGVSATWSNVLDQFFCQKFATPSTSNTSAPFTTGKDNTLALAFGFAYGVFDPPPSILAPWTQDQNSSGFANQGVIGQQTIANAGTQVTATINWSGSTPSSCGIGLVSLAGDVPQPG